MTGSPTVDDQGYLDLEALVDDSGAPWTYEARASAGEDTEKEPQTSVVELRPSDARDIDESVALEVFGQLFPDLDPSLLRDRRARHGAPTSPPPVWTSSDIEAWRSAAGPDEQVEVEVWLRDQPPLDIPTPGGLAEVAPLASLEAQFDRVRAIETRKTVLAASQVPFIELVEQHGGRVRWQGWLQNSFQAMVTPAAYDALLRADVLAISHARDAELDTGVGGTILRKATQLEQFRVADVQGDVPSGLDPTFSDMRVLVADSYFDQNHPAFTERLVEWHLWDDTNAQFDLATTEVSAANADTEGDSDGVNHGQLVLAQLVADATDDAAAASPKLDRSGMSLESGFVFIQKYEEYPATEQASAFQQLDFVGGFTADVFNWSQSVSGTDCDNDDPLNDTLNALYHLKMFVVNTPGNDGQGPGCLVNTPAMAAGSFTVNAYDIDSATSPSTVNTAGLTGGSAGGDALGRAVIDLVGPEGRELATMPEWNNAYVDVDAVGGSSFAAPVVSAAAANFKHNLMTLFGGNVANVNGVLFAAMSGMGDGQRTVGTATATNPAADPLWGAGRLRTRMWNNTGMDAPYGVTIHMATVDDLQQVEFPINGGNALTGTVDHLRSTVFWFEPNLQSDQLTQPAAALYAVELCHETQCWGSATTAPGVHRLVGPANPGGHVWKVRVTGLDVPESTDVDYHFGLERRSIRVATMYEDRARNDADGPRCRDEIDLSCAACCAQPGVSCPGNECL